MTKKVETILIKGAFSELGKIDLFPYSQEVEQITRRDEHCNYLIFKGGDFEFYRNFEDGEPMTKTKVFVMDDFRGFGLYNEDIDTIGERVNIIKRFPGDRLSFYVGDYDIWSPFEPLKGFGHFAIIYDKIGEYHHPVVLELTDNNRVSKVISLCLYSKDLYTLRYYIARNRVEITEYAKERKWSLSTYIAGMGEQERHEKYQKLIGIYIAIPSE